MYNGGSDDEDRKVPAKEADEDLGKAIAPEEGKPVSPVDCLLID